MSCLLGRWTGEEKWRCEPPSERGGYAWGESFSRKQLVCSFIGGTGGLAVALGTIAAVKAVVPPDLYYMQYRFQGIALDSKALLFVLGIIALTSLISGCLPALSVSKTNVS